MKKIKLTKAYIVISSVIFAIFTIIGYSYQKTNSWKLIFTNIETICISLLQVVILSLILIIAFNVIVLIIKKYSKINFKDNKINQFFSKHTFGISLLLILIGWGIYIIAFYPTIITIDAYNQLKQFLGLENYYTNSVVLLSKDMLITNHHPILHTLLLGGALNLGKLISNENLGLFMYSTLQIGVLACTFAYSLKYLKQNKAPNRIIYIVLFIYTFVPVFPFYAMTATKDVLYTAFVILLIIEIHKLVIRSEKINIKKTIYLIVLSILISLMRNNGILIIIPVWITLLLYDKKNRKKIGFILIFFMIVSLVYLQVILPYFKITQVSKREVLSIPFQQTARYIQNYDKEVTQDEKDVINKVLNYNLIKKNYSPTISDPVKATYNKNATKEDLKNYFKVWAKQFVKHPNVYIEATINNIYGYFYPSSAVGYIYYQDINNPLLRMIANLGYSNQNEKFMDYHFNTKTVTLRKKLKKNAEAFQHIPILGAIVNVAVNNWMVILLLIYFLTKKQKKCIIILLPSIITLLICTMSSVNNYFRYAMPIIFSNQLIISLVIKKNTSKEEE